MWGFCSFFRNANVKTGAPQVALNSLSDDLFAERRSSDACGPPFDRSFVRLFAVKQSAVAGKEIRHEVQRGEAQR